MLEFKENGAASLNKRFELHYAGEKMDIYLPAEEFISVAEGTVNGIDVECEVLNAILDELIARTDVGHGLDIFGGVQRGRTKWDLGFAFHKIRDALHSAVAEVVKRRATEKKLGLTAESVRTQLEGEARRLDALRQAGMPLDSPVSCASSSLRGTQAHDRRR